jgi:hypothetical protein
VYRTAPEHAKARQGGLVALRIRGFAQQFRGADLDMHFSLQQDLAPLRQLLRALRDEGMTKVTTLTEGGDFC